MATVVVHVKTDERYLLLGAGLGAYKEAGENTGTYPLLAVADSDGKIDWYRYDQLRVVSVDGRTPLTHLATDPFR